MREVCIIGVGMTRFGKWLERSMQDLGREATWKAIEDANISVKDIGVAYVGNGLPTANRTERDYRPARADRNGNFRNPDHKCRERL